MELKGTAEQGDYSLWFDHYEQPFSYYTVICSIVNIKKIY